MIKVVYCSKMKHYTYESELFFEGFKRVQDGKCWNFIDENGKVLSPSVWFDLVYSFVNGFAKVFLQSKLNYIDKNGNLLSPKWFDMWCSDFNEDGIAFVCKNKKYNAINRKGELLLDFWYDSIAHYKDKKYLQVLVSKNRILGDKWELKEIKKEL